MLSSLIVMTNILMTVPGSLEAWLGIVGLYVLISFAVDWLVGAKGKMAC